jgi:hypothetical protein
MVVILLSAHTVAMAESGSVWGDESLATSQRQWQYVDDDMSSDEYRRAYRRNQRLMAHAVKDTLRSVGVPETGANTVGAIGLTLSGTPLHLNKSETMALELTDVADKDRTLYLKFKLEWD